MRPRYITVDGSGREVDIAKVRRLARGGDPMMQALYGEAILAGKVPGKDRDDGIEWLRRSAESGYDMGMFCLGQAYTIEDDLDPDGSLARKWLGKAAESGCSDAMREYGDLLRRDGSDPEEAVRWLTAAAGKGDVRALYLKGRMLFEIDGTPEGRAAGMENIQKASDAGCPEASLYISRIYEEEDNGFMSVRMLRRASSQGSLEAMMELAHMMLRGTPYVEKDHAGAAELAEQAAFKGCGKAFGLLGSMHMFGIGVPNDVVRARELFEHGAMFDDTVSLTNLALLFSEGIGVRRDSKLAVALLERAVQLGSVPAMVNLGVMYAVGNDVRRDRDLAESIFLKARDLGYPDAERNLAALRSGTDRTGLVMYADGKSYNVSITSEDDRYRRDTESISEGGKG